MQKIKYSFVLPAYKARFFREALDSILAQTYKDFELIIVNDASPEDLDSIVKSYDDPRIRYYVNEQNIGGKDLVAQWNHCLEYAEGDYIILASDDDVYFPQYLEKMDALVQKYPEVNVFRPRIQYIDENGNVGTVDERCDEKINALEYAYRLFLGNIGSGIPHFVFNSKELKSIGGFVNYPKAWCADEATVLLMAKNGICIDENILFYFRSSGINISTINSYAIVKEKLKSQRLFYDFMQDYIHELPINTTEEQEMKCLLQIGLSRRFRAVTAASINSMTFADAIRIFPDLFSLPWASLTFIVKRMSKKIFQILHF